MTKIDAIQKVINALRDLQMVEGFTQEEYAATEEIRYQLEDLKEGDAP